MTYISPVPKFQFFDANGNPLSGGKLYSYAAGTTTPLATYTDSSGNTPNTNPVILNSRGEASVWLGDASYKFKLLTSTDVEIWTVDNIVGGVYFSQAGTGATSQTIQSKLKQTVSVLDFIPSAEHAAIQNGTSTYDCYTAIVNAINSVTYDWMFLHMYSSGPAVYFPPGVYTCSQSINIKKSVRLYGDGAGSGYFSGARIKFPAGVHGIIVNSYYTLGTGVDPAWTADPNVNTTTATSGATSTIEGLQIVGGGGATAHGIWLRGRANIRNCYIADFSGNGIHIVGYGTPPLGGVSDDQYGNANVFRVDNTRVNDCGGHGLYTDGGDSNAGVVIGLDSVGNGGWGIFDSSFLGNTYIACHTSGNVAGPYKTDNNNASNMFLNCYTESGQGPCDMVERTYIVGGLWGSDDGSGNVLVGNAQQFFIDGFRSVPGAVTKPSFRTNANDGTGFYSLNSTTWGWASNKNDRARLGDGWIKLSTSGSYWSTTQAACEFVQNSASLHSSFDYCSSSAYTGPGKYIRVETAAGTGFTLLSARNASGGGLDILGNGNVQNTNNSYGALSDIKLKQDVTDASSQWDDIKAIRLRKYRLKNDAEGQTHIGVIAQELESVSPGLVEEMPDRNKEGELTGETTKTVKYSVLFVKALKALQEAMARIELLEKNAK